MSRIAIVAALPSELNHLVKGWKKERQLEREISLWQIKDSSGDELIAICAGMGKEAVTRAFAAAERKGRLDLVLSVGLAGATGITSSLAETGAAGHLGEVSALSEVIDAATGERFLLTNGKRRLRIVTLDHVANADEKRRLAESYAAVLVDMEAATIARLAAMRSLPMCCIKAVSDEHDQKLPDINRFIGTGGQLRMVAFAGYVFLRPRFWLALAQLARGSKRASAALAAKLRLFLQHKDWEYTNRTGHIEKKG